MHGNFCMLQQGERESASYTAKIKLIAPSKMAELPEEATKQCTAATHTFDTIFSTFATSIAIQWAQPCMSSPHLLWVDKPLKTLVPPVISACGTLLTNQCRC